MNASHRTGQVRDIMTLRPLTIQSHESAALAGQMMLWAGVRHLPVLADTSLVGVVSDRDLLRLENGARPVREIMSEDLRVIEPEASLEEAAARMALQKIDCLPVLRDGNLLGILTSTDLLAERGRIVHKSSRVDLPEARDVMVTAVTTVNSDDLLIDAVEKMLGAELRHLPVVDADERPVGMVSERDLRSALGDLRDFLTSDEPPRSPSERVEEIMTPNPICVRFDASLADVAQALIDERVGALLVVDEAERLVGIVSYVDVLAYLLGKRA